MVAMFAMAFEFLSFKGSTPPDRFHDFFSAYYLAAQHNWSTLHMLTERGVSGFVNMPIIAFLFAPLRFVGPRIAVVLFTIVGLCLTLALWFLLVLMACLQARERWLLAMLFLANGPLMHGLKFGNTSHFILFAIVAGLCLIRVGRSGIAGALLGAAALIKPPLLLFGISFAFRRDLRGAIVFLAVCIAAAALSLVVFGFAENQHWFQASIVEYSQGWLGAYNVQSIPGVVLRLNVDAKLIDWVPSLPDLGDKLIARVLAATIFLIAGAVCLRRRSRLAWSGTDVSERRDLKYLLVICLCLITSPLTWSHYYVWLLIPIAFFLAARLSFLSFGIERVTGWVAITLVIPLVEWPWSISDQTLMTLYRSVFMSHLFFGGLLWFGLIAWRLVKTGGIFSHPTASSGMPSVIDSGAQANGRVRCDLLAQNWAQ